jgi:hypothetical protein
VFLRVLLCECEVLLGEGEYLLGVGFFLLEKLLLELFDLESEL